MATKLLSNFGQCSLVHATAGLYAGGFSKFTLTGAAETVKADRMLIGDCGPLVQSDEQINKTTYTLDLESTVVDWNSLELATGLTSQVSATVPAFNVVETTVPLTTPYEIPLPGITTAKAATVEVSVFADGAFLSNTGIPIRMNLTRVTGTPTFGQFKVDTSTPGEEKLVFHSGQAGAPVVIYYEEDLTNKLTIGLEAGATELKSFKFGAKFCNDDMRVRLICPNVSKTSVLNMEGGALTTIKNSFSVNLAPGYSTAYHLIKL